MTEPPLELAPRALRTRDLVIGAVIALAVAAGLIVAAGGAVGFGDLRDVLRDGNFGWLAVCVVAQVVVFSGYAMAMREAIAADDGPRLSDPLVLRLTLASFATTQVFAFGGIAGLVVVFWAMRRCGMSSETAAVRLIGLNTAVYLVFGFIGFGAAAAALLADTVPLGMSVPWFAGIPIVLFVAGWFTEPQRVDRWRWRPLAVGVGAAVWVRRAINDRAALPMFFGAICYWLADIVSLGAALHAFGARFAVSALVLCYTTGYLVQSLPIPLVATGGVDAATAVLLHTGAGIPLELAIVGVAAHRVFAFWLPVVPGAICAVTLPAAARSIEEQVRVSEIAGHER
jgi:uncharacterized membrane protein YbhN (UPF0104 family)